MYYVQVYYVQTNERHHNPRAQPKHRKYGGGGKEQKNGARKPKNAIAQGHDPIHDNSEKKWLRRSTILAVCSCFFLGLGWSWLAKFVGFV